MHKIIINNDNLMNHDVGPKRFIIAVKDTGAYEIIEMVYLRFRVVLDGKKS